MQAADQRCLIAEDEKFKNKRRYINFDSKGFMGSYMQKRRGREALEDIQYYRET